MEIVTKAQTLGTLRRSATTTLVCINVACYNQDDPTSSSLLTFDTLSFLRTPVHPLSLDRQDGSGDQEILFLDKVRHRRRQPRPEEDWSQ